MQIACLPYPGRSSTCRDNLAWLRQCLLVWPVGLLGSGQGYKRVDSEGSALMLNELDAETPIRNYE